jgi:large subunit ribosomal protein L17
MFRNQLTALFTHQRITTTVAKAKDLRPLAERMVTLARTGTLANRRRVLQMVPDNEVVGHLFDEIAPRFSDRDGGYTRIVRLGRRRGDNAELAIIEFVDFEPSFDEEGGGPAKTSLMDRAKGMFGRKSEAEATSEEGETEDEVAVAEDSSTEGPEAADVVADDELDGEPKAATADEPEETETADPDDDKTKNS